MSGGVTSTERGCHSLSAAVDTHGRTRIYMVPSLRARHHRLPSPPAGPPSPISGVRRHTAGVSSSLIQDAPQGVFSFRGRRGTHKSMSLAHPDTGRPKSAGRLGVGESERPAGGLLQNISCCLGQSGWMTNTLYGGRGVGGRSTSVRTCL